MENANVTITTRSICIIAVVSFLALAFPAKGVAAQEPVTETEFSTFEIDAPPVNSTNPGDSTKPTAELEQATTTLVPVGGTVKLTTYLNSTTQGLLATGILLGHFDSNTTLIVPWQRQAFTGNIHIPQAFAHVGTWSLRAGNIDAKLGLLGRSIKLKGIDAVGLLGDDGQYGLTLGHTPTGDSVAKIVRDSSAWSTEVWYTHNSGWGGFALQTRQQKPPFYFSAGIMDMSGLAGSTWRTEYRFNNGYTSVEYQRIKQDDTFALPLNAPTTLTMQKGEFTLNTSIKPAGTLEIRAIGQVEPSKLKSIDIGYSQRGKLNWRYGGEYRQTADNETLLWQLGLSRVSMEGLHWNLTYKALQPITTAEWEHSAQFAVHSSDEKSRVLLSAIGKASGSTAHMEVVSSVYGPVITLAATANFQPSKRPVVAEMLRLEWPKNAQSSWQAEASGSSLGNIQYRIGWKGSFEWPIKSTGAVDVVVFNDTNHNGKPDSNEDRPEAKVTLNNGEVLHTNLQGYASFPRLRAGKYEVRVDTKPSGQLYYANVKSLFVDVQHGKRITVYVPLSVPGSIVVRALYDTDGNGIPSVGDRALQVTGIRINNTDVVLGSTGTTSIMVYPGMQTVTAYPQWQKLILVGPTTRTISVTGGETRLVELLYQEPVVEIQEF